MVNNGTLAYDHDRDGTHTELAGCETGGRNKDYETFMAVRYADNKLSVSHRWDLEYISYGLMNHSPSHGGATPVVYRGGSHLATINTFCPSIVFCQFWVG